jgi:hypothetical protein
MAFLVRLPGSPAWVLRAARSGSPVGDHLCGCAANGQRELAYSRMATLLRLEDLGYPAPRAVRTRDGELIAELNGWCVRAATYIDGTVIRPALDQLRLLGAALASAPRARRARAAGRRDRLQHRIHRRDPPSPGPEPGDHRTRHGRPARPPAQPARS